MMLRYYQIDLELFGATRWMMLLVSSCFAFEAEMNMLSEPCPPISIVVLPAIWIADNRERKGRGYRIQEAAERGGLPTIQRETAEAIEFNGRQMGDNCRHYKENKQML